MDLAADAQVRAALARFDDRFAAGDADAMGEIFAEDGQMLFPQREAIEGRPAIHANWQRTFALYDLSAWRTTWRIVDVHGDRAYTMATYTETMVPREPGPRRLVVGRLILFWRRDPDGVWRVILAMNSHVKPIEEVP